MPNPRAAGTTTEMIVRLVNEGVPEYWVYDIGANRILTRTYLKIACRSRSAINVG